MFKIDFQKERVRTLGVAFLFAVIIAAAFLTFFFARVLDEDDVTYYYLPAFKFYSDAVGSGESFKIIPQVLSGFPAYLSQVGGFYDPLNYLLFKIFSFPAAYYLRIMLNYWLAAFFMYLFARSLKLHHLASLLAAFSFITAQHLIPGMNILRSNSFFLLPGLFYVLHKLHRNQDEGLRKNWSYLFLGVFILGISLLGGYTQLVLYGLTAVGAFMVYLLFRRFSWRFVFLISFTFGLGMLVFLPQLLKILEFIPITERTGGLSWEFAQKGGGVTGLAKNFYTTLLPFLNFGTAQSLHIGLLDFVFLFAVLFFRKKEPLIYFFVGLFIFAILSSFSYPLFWLMHHLPFFKYFRFPPHWLLVASFAMSVWAGIGLHKFVSKEDDKSALVRFFKGRSGFYAVSGVLALNFLIPVWIVAENNTFSQDILFSAPWVVKQIRKLEEGQKGLFRTFNLYPGDTEFNFITKPFNPGPLALYNFKREYVQTHMSPAIWDVESIRGFDMLVPRRYQRVLEYLDEGGSARFGEPGAATNPEHFRLKIPEHYLRILGMMNVKYIWSVIRLPEDYMGKLVVQVGRDVFHSPFISFIPEIPIYLFENKELLVRVFAPQEIAFLKEDENNFPRVIEEDNDYRKIGFIECNECPEGKMVTQTFPSIEIGEKHNDSLKFKIRADGETWVVVSNSFFPGWRAYVDGQETKLYYANYVYQGIKVSAGEHEVWLKYR